MSPVFLKKNITSVQRGKQFSSERQSHVFDFFFKIEIITHVFDCFSSKNQTYIFDRFGSKRQSHKEMFWLFNIIMSDTVSKLFCDDLKKKQTTIFIGSGSL